MIWSVIMGDRSLSVRRAIYDGATLEGIGRVRSYTLEPIDIKAVHTVPVTTHMQYRDRCPHHGRCWEHVAVHSDDIYLMPQFAAKGVGTLSNIYSRLAQLVISKRMTADEYKTDIYKQLMTKSRVVRHDCMGGVVDGSLGPSSSHAGHAMPIR